MMKKTVKIMLLILALVAFFLLPDILYWLRSLLKILPGIKQIVSSISDTLYIQTMNTALFNCFAIVISFMAYNIAKSPYNAQSEQRKQEIIRSVVVLRTNIQINCKTINSLKNNTGNANDLSISNEINDCIICLYSAQKITEAHFKFCIDYVDDVKAINQALKDNQNTDQHIEAFCKKYFKENTLEYSPILKEITDNLDKIKPGG